MKRLTVYLQRIFDVDAQTADQLVPLVISGERNYLFWLYNYDKLERLGVDERDLLQRLKRPFPFGFVIKEILDSDLGDDVKLKAAVKSWKIIDLEAEEGIPSYILKAIKFLIDNAGFNQDYIDFILGAALILNEHSLVAGDDLRSLEDLFDYVMESSRLDVGDKVVFLLAALSLSRRGSTVQLKLYEKFLKDNHIPFSVRQDFAQHAASLDTMKYLIGKLGEYFREDAEELPSSPLDYIALYHIPFLQRKSISWLAQVKPDNRNIKQLVNMYFKVNISRDGEVYQTLGALDLCNLYYDQLDQDYVLDIMRKALKSNRIEVRRTAEKYHKAASA